MSKVSQILSKRIKTFLTQCEIGTGLNLSEIRERIFQECDNLTFWLNQSINLDVTSELMHTPEITAFFLRYFKYIKL